jgi:antitoxin (DNA-binding transcriptional repressor) of toxin-antitoxin stability system
MLEQGVGEIVVLRNRHPVAKLVPGAQRLTALEALSDLHRVLPDQEGAAWLRDAAKMDRKLGRELRDPWA